jgi:hypothetical protein
LNGSALKYGLTILIETYDIAHDNGPFNASESDTTIFQEILKDECVECDLGAKGEFQLKHPKVAKSHVFKQMNYTVRAHHEMSMASSSFSIACRPVSVMHHQS